MIPRGSIRIAALALFVGVATACNPSNDRPAPAAAATQPTKPASSSAAEADRCPHGLPSSLCTKCTPALAAVFQAKGDWCAEHGFPESFCPICNPAAVAPDVTSDEPGSVAIEARIVRFRSPEIERNAGIETATAQPGEATDGVECTARIAFDADKVADVRAIIPGIVRRIRVELGTTVSRGTPLFELESTRVSEIQGALQNAREVVRVAQAERDRQLELRASGISATRQVEIAEQELASAKAQVGAAEATLRMAGAQRAAPSGRYTITAPLAGTIVRRPAVVGLLATESDSLATIADTSVVWALCDVSEADAGRVAVGQNVVVTVDGTSLDPIEGSVTWIAAEVDPRTRTVTTRAELPNARGQLRANQFARARIETSGLASAVSVPRDAVQRVEGQEVVFVRTAPGVYHPRVIERHGDGKAVLVEGRVQPGDEVVTTGAVLLRTEIIPGSIGAGCCEVEAPGAD